MSHPQPLHDTAQPDGGIVVPVDHDQPATVPVPPDGPPPSPRFGPPTAANPFWRVVVVSGAAFCVSCLLWITAGFGNPQAPGNQWLNRNGLILIAATGVAALASAVAAMIVDQSQTRRMRPATADDAAADGCSSDSSPQERSHE